VSTYGHYLKGGRDAVALFVEDESAVLHAASGEETDVARAGEFLRCFAGVIICGGHATDWADNIKVVGDERFVGDQ
jgi:hypothetical protein